MEQYRQGDILLVRTEKKPKGKVKTCTELVVAYGEATGHAHRLTARRLVVWKEKEQTYVQVGEDGKITHEEHGMIQVAQNRYQVIQQRQLNLEGEVERIKD